MIIETKYEKDKLLITHAQDASGILAQNRELAKGDGWDADKEYRHFAQLPTIAYYRMLQKYPEINEGDNSMKTRALYKAMRDPEFSIYKIRHE